MKRIIIIYFLISFFCIFVNSNTKTTLKIGSEIEVDYQGSYYPAKILKFENNKYFITYTGYDSSYDEWVGLDRIKTSDIKEEKNNKTKSDTKTDKTKYYDAYETTINLKSGEVVTISSSGIIYKNKKEIGSLDVTKTYVYINGKEAGYIDVKGFINVNGKKIGRLDPENKIWRNSEKIGYISYGTFYLGEKEIGTAQMYDGGSADDYVAFLYFVFFDKEFGFIKN